MRPGHGVGPRGRKGGGGEGDHPAWQGPRPRKPGTPRPRRSFTLKAVGCAVGSRFRGPGRPIHPTGETGPKSTVPPKRPLVRIQAGGRKSHSLGAGGHHPKIIPRAIHRNWGKVKGKQHRIGLHAYSDIALYRAQRNGRSRRFRSPSDKDYDRGPLPMGRPPATQPGIGSSSRSTASRAVQTS
jgi:hypothetical protein